MTEPTVNAEYRCKSCGPEWIPVPVRERRGETESVVIWLNDVVAGSVQDEHRRRAPQCKCAGVDLRIPHNVREKYIGQAVRQ